MKKICIPFLCALLALSSCSQKAELERIDRDIASLREENQSLYEELSAEIDAMEQRLLAKIKETQERLGGDIDAAFDDLMNLIAYKMEAAEDYLQTELLAKKQKCDQTVMDVRSYVDKIKGHMDEVLTQTSIYLMDAMKAGDAQTELKLRQLMTTLQEVEQTVDYIDRNMLFWKSRLDQIQSSGLYNAMDAMDEAVRTLDSFNIQQETEDMEQRVQEFAVIKMDEMSGEEMLSLKALISEMEDWLYETDNLATDSASMVNDMGSMLDDWQSSAEDLYSQLESKSQEVLDAFEDIYAELEDAAGNAEELISQIEDAVDDIHNYSSQIDEYNDLLESQYDDLMGMIDDVFDLTNEAADSFHSVYFSYSDLYDACQEWKDKHWYLF